MSELHGYRVKVVPWCWGMVPDKSHSVVRMDRSSHRLIKRFAEKREERVMVLHNEQLIVTTEKGKQALESAASREDA